MYHVIFPLRTILIVSENGQPVKIPHPVGYYITGQGMDSNQVAGAGNAPAILTL